jgi:hypothetical protein
MLGFIQSLSEINQVLVSFWLVVGFTFSGLNYFKWILSFIPSASYTQNATGKMIDLLWLTLTVYLYIQLS